MNDRMVLVNPKFEAKWYLNQSFIGRLFKYACCLSFDTAKFFSTVGFLEMTLW
jgi:hypothetical protein